MIIDRLLGGPIERKTTDIWALIDKVSGASKTGVTVNAETALQSTTGLACTQAIACGVAMLPCKLYRPLPNGGREEARDDPLFHLLDLAPNDWQTSVEFIETLVIHAVLCGNGYAFVNRINGEARELVPLLPGQIKSEQAADYRLTYRLRPAEGPEIIIPRANMLHLRGPSWNGFLGLDAVRLAREAIGLSLATEETHARLHSNGARPGGVLSTDGNLNEAQIKIVREQWQQTQGGVANAMKTAILQGGLKWTPLAMSGVDGQHIETRRFQIEEICRAFGVFPQMVGHADKTATYASAEQFFLAHVVHTLSRWTRRLEKRLIVDLMTPTQIKAGLYPKFSFQALLRGDNKTRAEFYTALITLGIMTRNEARLLEEMNPLDGLDDPLVPLNMGTQAERDAIAADVAGDLSKMIGHNGGLPLDQDEIATIVTAAIARRRGSMSRTAA